MRSSLYVTLMSGASAPTGALALLAGYDQGFAFLANAAGGRGQVAVKDTGTPANNLSNADAPDLITNAGTSPKLVKQQDGTEAWSPHNLILYSEAFGSWATQAGLDSAAGSQPDHLGGSTAVLITEDSGASTHGVSSVATLTNGPSPVRLVLRVKPNGRTHVAFRTNVFDGLSKNYGFSLSGSGSITTTGAATEAITYDSVTGYYELELTGSPAITSSGFAALYMSDASISGDTIPLYTGDGASGVYLSRCEFYQYTGVEGRYVPTTTAAVFEPAFEWDSTYGSSGGWRLLVEPAATNLHTYSSDRSNAAWVKDGATVSVDAGQAPDGTTTMDKIVESSATAAHYIYQQKTGLSSGDPYTYSEIVAAAERTKCWMYLHAAASAIAYYDLEAGTVLSTSGSASPAATIEELDTVGGVTRYRITLTASIAQTTINAGIGPTTADGVTSYLGDGSSGILVWGSQRETGTVATSPIPTYGATVTRAADLPTLATSLIPYADTGTWVAKGVTRDAATTSVILEIESASTDLFRSNAATSGHLSVNTSGSTVVSLDAGTIVNDTDFSLAYAYAADDFAASLDGGAVVADAAGAIPPVDTVRIGHHITGGLQLNGYIDEIRLIPQRLPNATLEALAA